MAVFCGSGNSMILFQLSDFNSDANTTLQLHVWDIKDGLIDDWNVSLEYNETDPQGNEDNIEFWKSIFADGNVTSLSVQQDENGVYSLPESTHQPVYIALLFKLVMLLITIPVSFYSYL